MTNIRRYWQPGQLYFLTHVTYNRMPFLVERADLLRNAVATQRSRSPFDLVAWVILPDHWHLILDPKDCDVSLLMRRIKLSFSTRLRKVRGIANGQVWQNRFWDHILRDEDDFKRHLDYIHYNPVKHGMVDDPFLWPHSSLDEYFNHGYYARDWGAKEPTAPDGEYGE